MKLLLRLEIIPLSDSNAASDSKIQTKSSTRAYTEGWERIFSQDKKEPSAKDSN